MLVIIPTIIEFCSLVKDKDILMHSETLSLESTFFLMTSEQFTPSLMLVEECFV